MDPNNPNFRQQFSGFSDDLLTNPKFQLFLQRMGNTSLQPSPQYQTPTQFPLRNHVIEECTPETVHDSNTQFNESEEDSVPETPQYPPPVPELQSNQVVARPTRIWSVAEDETLIGLYLEISENAIKGTSQKATSLWRDVHAAYQSAHAEKPNIIPPRPMKSRLPEGGSGYNEADRIKSASKLFHLAQGRNFAFLHAVEMLNKDPNWRPKLRWSLSKEERKAVRDVEEQGSAGSGKRSRDDGGDETPIDGFSSGGIQRPEGVKKAKAKRKGKEVASESGSSELSERMKEFATIREREAILKEERIKIEKDKEQRKREELDFHKMKTWFDILQALKNSPTPLTPEEESYKNFLLGKLQGL
ncbi:uncharacterized protein LOC110732948 [Chenopodium quinoa]|uniref:uncharacterized protein LOC110732948 n=1 Tax=Chenopodium quinoa TaxID=63459 RepID=UPI000B77E1B5|nr:uncharacterized protein LOC110732948 [Chenopodium quinoa]